jgi:DNA-binding response OmpR family regulator
MIMNESLLDGKRILIVDDEPDVLATLEELLSMCDLVKASSFLEANDLLTTQYFDLAILDIMGVDGYKLLEIAVERKVIAVMLTAHALSPEDTIKSFKDGAASYVPKEEMENIVKYLNDILQANKEGKSLWWRWMERFSDFYDRRFGLDWKDRDKDFWESLKFYDRA